MVIANLMKNAAAAKAIVAKAIPQIPTEPNWPLSFRVEERHHDRQEMLAEEKPSRN